MKQINTLLFALLTLITVTTSSCEAIGQIFKAGVWVGVIIVIVIIALIIWIINRVRK
jgi:hypothetical protein